MLVVDPLKRITVPEILAHPWTHRGLPKYLTRAITALATPSLVGTLSTLVTQGNEKVVDGLGKVDQAIVVELADAIGVVSVVFQPWHLMECAQGNNCIFVSTSMRTRSCPP
jgi:hypothetical protein